MSVGCTFYLPRGQEALPFIRKGFRALIMAIFTGFQAHIFYEVPQQPENASEYISFPRIFYHLPVNAISSMKQLYYLSGLFPSPTLDSRGLIVSSARHVDRDTLSRSQRMDQRSTGIRARKAGCARVTGVKWRNTTSIEYNLECS